jgi:adenylate kinase family enzyme
MAQSKLIILRGPSGAGKSMVAKLVHSRVSNKTALIDQDYYRHTMFNNLHTDLEAPRYVMFAGVQIALDYGYDVILEGFLGMAKYKAYFDKLLNHHPMENYFFYFDVSFDETLRRHKTRQKSSLLDQGKMAELYSRTGPSGYSGECIIPETGVPIDRRHQWRVTVIIVRNRVLSPRATDTGVSKPLVPANTS